MKNTFKVFSIAAIIAAIGIASLSLTGLTGCDNGSTSGEDPTPVAADFEIGNLTQTAGNVTAVTITPKSGKSSGVITVKYNGSTIIPQTAGSYPVTFDVAAAAGWNAASGLSAGTLTITAAASDDKVATPIANPPAGAVAPNQPVTITCATEGAAIWYTIDGSDPKTSATKQTGASPVSVTVTAAMTIKVIAVKDGIDDSDLLEAAYTVDPNMIATPIPDLAAGTYNEAKQLSFSPPIGITIYYTTDGNDPTGLSSTYSTPIAIDKDMTVKAMSYRAGDAKSSPIVTFNYVLKADKPAASVAAGSYPYGTTVTLTTNVAADFYYTTDGTAPTTASTKYTSPIAIEQNITLKAVAVNAGWTPSDILEAGTYIPTVVTPTADKAAGKYLGNTTGITLSTTDGAQIRYTTDGTAPTATTGTVYSSPITINPPMTLKAIGVKGTIISSVLEVAYTLPTAADYNLPTNLTQRSADSLTAVTTITAKTGIPTAAITIYYEGINGTNYTKSATLPTAAGTYAVTFDVASATGAYYAGTSGFSAGTLEYNYFTVISEVGTFLSGLPANTAAAAYNIAVNVSNISNLGTQLNNNAAKYVYLYLGSNVTSIPDRTFGGNDLTGCPSLTGITIPDSVTSIGDYAFYKCTSLASVSIGSGVTSIGKYAFQECTSLTSVTIPDSVTSIGGSAFFRCSSLTSIIIPDSVTRIEQGAFSFCTSLTSVTIGSGVTSIEGSIPIGDGSYGGYGAFSFCTSLTSVTIGSGVTSIGSRAFADCTSLTSVTIPDSVTSIGYVAFDSCTSLTSVTFLGTITESNFNNEFNTFPGDLRTKYFAGGIGTYTRPDNTTFTWTKQ